MLKWILGTVLGAVIGITGYFMWYLGGFKPVTISEKDHAELHLLYHDHTGPYHKIAPGIIDVEHWAREHGIPCQLSFGQYLDDPNTVEEGRLHARGGCLLEAPADYSPDLAKQLPSNMHLMTLPAAKYVEARFEGSPGIGPMRVYPKVDEYFAAKKARIGGPVIEIYEVHADNSMSTTYLFPIAP